MKNIKFFGLALSILILIVPAVTQAATGKPAYGVTSQLLHKDTNDDRMDVVVINYTEDVLTWEGTPRSHDVEILSCHTDKEFPKHGYESNLGPKGYRASLTSIQWTHTKEDDPFLQINYNIGGKSFQLMIYPEHESKIITDLMLAYHIASAVGDGVVMALGDEEAVESLVKNMQKAAKEGNKLVENDGNNKSWAAVSAHEDMDHSPSDLTYPIIYEKINGKYNFKDSSNDHIAFDLDDYVVQVCSVNTENDLTGYPQIMCYIYTKEQWNENQYPYGHIQWWQGLTKYSFGSQPDVGIDYHQCAGKDIFVETHANTFNGGYMYYSIGSVNKGTHEVEQNVVSRSIFQGQNPTIAVCDEQVVLVYSEDNDLFSLVGNIPCDLSTINWETSSDYLGGGAYADLSGTLEGGVVEEGVTYNSAVMLAYQISSEDTEIYYRFATRTSAEDLWWHQARFVDYGALPAVAFDGLYTVILVYQGSYTPNSYLYYKTGTCDYHGNDYTVLWHSNGTGRIPVPDGITEAENLDVAFDYNTGNVIVTYNDKNTGYISYIVGKYGYDSTDGGIDWEETITDGKGYLPSIAMYGDETFVQIAATDPDYEDSSLFWRTGAYIDY